MNLPQTVNELLAKANQEVLLEAMIAQLNKDFQLANIDYSFDIKLSPEALKHALFKKLLHLIEHNYDDYLNLLYRIDVSEKELLGLSENSSDNMDGLTLVVLKRIYTKIWFRNRL